MLERVLSTDVLVTNHVQCTDLGRGLFEKQATIEQVYVAVSLCEGLVHPMDSGLGGGFQALIHRASDKNDVYLMAREYSPWNSSFIRKPLVFGNSVGVPSVLAGYAKLLGVDKCLREIKRGTSTTTSTRRRETKRPFYDPDQNCVYRIMSGTVGSGLTPSLSGVRYREIFEPVIELATKGFRVSQTLKRVLEQSDSLPFFLQTKSNGLATNERLAKFLTFISQHPLRLIDPYTRWSSQRKLPDQQNVRRIMLNDVVPYGSLLTEEDFFTYRAYFKKPLTIDFTVHNTVYRLITLPSPAGGETIAFFAKLLETGRDLHLQKHRMNDAQLSCLFLLYSKYAFAAKAYFRQMKVSQKHRMIVHEAPIIARKFYYDLIVRDSDSSLVDYLVNEVPGIPRRFGTTVFPAIRVKSRTRAVDKRTSIDRNFGTSSLSSSAGKKVKLTPSKERKSNDDRNVDHDVNASTKKSSSSSSSSSLSSSSSSSSPSSSSPLSLKSVDNLNFYCYNKRCNDTNANTINDIYDDENNKNNDNDEGDETYNHDDDEDDEDENNDDNVDFNDTNVQYNNDYMLDDALLRFEMTVNTARNLTKSEQSLSNRANDRFRDLRKFVSIRDDEKRFSSNNNNNNNNNNRSSNYERYDYDNEEYNDFFESPYGTTNVIIKRGNRSLIATSSINHSFGSLIFSQNLGIPYNNVLRDFTPRTWYQTRSFDVATDDDRIGFTNYYTRDKKIVNRTSHGKRAANNDDDKYNDHELDETGKDRRIGDKNYHPSHVFDPSKLSKNTKLSSLTKRNNNKNDKQTTTTSPMTKKAQIANRPKSHSVPQSSMACTMIVNPQSGFPVFGIGAAGGFKITSAVMNVMWNYFVLGDTLKKAVSRLRLVTKLNYKTRATEIWYEFPVDSSYYLKLRDEISLSYTGPAYRELNFLNDTEKENEFGRIAHAPKFFYDNRDVLSVRYIFEAGYSAVTAFSTMRESKAQATFDPRRGGKIFIKY